MNGHPTASRRVKLIGLCCWAVAALALLLSPSAALVQKFEIKPVAGCRAARTRDDEKIGIGRQ